MGATDVGPQARKEYLARMRERYRGADRTEKSRLLDEVCEVTGYHRKAAIRSLRRGGGGRRGPRPGRPVRYGARVVRALRAIWTAAGYPWSVRLHALLPVWVPRARKRLRLDEDTEGRLRTMSPRQMDRVLQPFKRELRRRQYGRTKPGTLLKHQIPVKTDRWDVSVPGFTEIDLVAHSGDRADGDFAYTLNLTDIHTTWVESGAVLGKSQHAVQEKLDELRRNLPFRLAGIDSDNGSEFINAHLHRYCQAHTIQFTRGRPYKKDDNAHIEQKNWTHVRKLLGYVRYDTPAAVAAINALYADLRLLQNLFLPSVKLLRKERRGAKVRRRYDAPRTPLERVQSCPTADRHAVERLAALQRRLDPFDLAGRIDASLDQVFTLANHRTTVRGRAVGREDSPVLPDHPAGPAPNVVSPKTRRPGARVRAGQKPSLTDGRAA